MLAGMRRGATLSDCRTYRLALYRQWDERPSLLACMFNPSDADHQVDDPTVTLLCHVASHNGFGGLTVVNGIPLRCSTPGPAIAMVNTWHKRSAWDERDQLQRNLAVIVAHVERADAVLLAWGALAERCADWFDNVREEIASALPPAHAARLYCLGRTKAGYPMHPLARGKHKVRKDALLQPWRPAS